MKAAGEGRSDYFKFNVTSDMIPTGGLDVTVDIDQTSQNVFWAGSLLVEASDFTGYAIGLPNYSLWGWNRDAYADGTKIQAVANPGADTDSNANLALKIMQPGTYTIQVSDRYFFGVPSGASYNLNVSIAGHKVDGLTFSPTPVIENEAETFTASGQNIGASGGWYTLHNPEIGDGQTNGIDSSNSYTIVQGFGDGSEDAYTFAITAADLVKDSGSFTDTTTNSGPYYLSATITLSGPVTAGDVWTLTLDGANYSYTVSGADSALKDVADGLKALIPSLYSPVTAASTTTTLSLADSTGFRMTSPKITHVNPAVVTTTAGSNTTLFKSMAFDLSGAITGSGTWKIVLDGTAYSVTPATSVSNTASLLRTAIDGNGGFTATVSGSKVTVTRTDNASFKGQFAQNGLSPQGRVVISGVPDDSTRAAERWTSASITFTDANDGENVIVNVDGTPYSVSGGTSTSMVSSFATALTTAGYTATASSGVLTISKTSGFTVDYSVTKGSAQGTMSVTNSTWSAANLTLSVPGGGTFTSSDTWSVTVDGTEFTSTAKTSLDLTGADLSTKIAASGTYTVTYDSASDSLVIRKAGASAPTVSTSVKRSVGGTVTIADGGLGERTATISGTVVTGEVYSLTMGTGGSAETVTYTALGTDTNDSIAAALATLVDGLSGYTASATTNVITIDDDGAVLRPTVASSISPVASANGTLTSGSTTTGQIRSIVLAAR